MIFGESANTNKKEDMATIKTADPKYSMPRWCPAGLTRSQKRKLQRLRAKESQEKEAEKIFNDTHPQYPPPQKKWRPKAVEEKPSTTKIENKTTLVQHPAGMADSPASKAGQSAPGADRPTPARGPFAPDQRAPPPVLLEYLALRKGVNILFGDSAGENISKLIKSALNGRFKG